MTDYRLNTPREQVPLDQLPYHQWTLPNGQSWVTFYRSAAGFLLRFFDLADFCVTGDGRKATCTPVPGTSEETCHHLFLNQVLPLMMGQQGKLVFHASAVTLGNRAVAFLGESGRGKSTLAAAFATAGYRFLTDDGLILELAGGAYQVLPSHPSIRLREDSRGALLDADIENTAGAIHALKERVPAQALLPNCDKAQPLLAAYFLGDGTSPVMTVEHIRGTEALVAWVKHAFVLDIDDQGWLAEHFKGIIQLSDMIPCYHLDYPRRFGDLDRLRTAILEHARSREQGA